MSHTRSDRDRKIIYLELRDLLLKTSSSLQELVTGIRRDNLEEKLDQAFFEEESLGKRLWDLRADIWALEDFSEEERE